MSRYFKPPKEYDPSLVFQLREQLEGGNLAPRLRQIPSPDPYGRAEALVLVHGFNNHYGEAGAAYHGFRLYQYDRASPGLVPPGLEAMLADCFWPGDAAWWGLFDLADFLVYPASVGTAKEAAPLLAEHLRTSPNLRIVHFVAHSLGCRVVLETIDDIMQHGGPRIGKVCLMAAAVPLFMLRTGGHLADAIKHPPAVRVLYSDDDWVLGDTFPPGQTLAGEGEGMFPTALGLNGPLGITGAIDAFDITDARHGDYWGHSKKPPAKIAGDRIAEFFDFGAWERTFEIREPGTALRAVGEAPREIGYKREIG